MPGVPLTRTVAAAPPAIISSLTLPPVPVEGVAGTACHRPILPPTTGWPSAGRFAANAASFSTETAAWLATLRDVASTAQDWVLAKWHLSHTPDKESRRALLTTLGIHSPELAVQVASSHWGSREARMTLALGALNGDPFLVAARLHTFNVTPDQRLTLAKATIMRSDRETLQDLLTGNWLFRGVLTPRERLACIDHLLLPATIAYAPSDEVVQLAVLIYRGLFADGPERTERDRRAMAKDPAGFLHAHFLNPNQPYCIRSIPEVRRDLRTIADADPTILPHRFVATAWDRVERLEAGLGILRVAMKRELAGMSVPDDSLTLLADAMGYDAAAVCGMACSDNTLGDLYELSLDIEACCEHPPFAGIAIDPRLWHGEDLKRFIAVLGLLRDLHHLRGNGEVAWRTLVNELGLPVTGITIDNVAALGPQIEQWIAHQVIVMLQDAFHTTTFEATYAQLAALQKAWGDLTPIYTLLARFQGKPEWRDEIPALAQVFAAALEGRFAELKFGDFLSTALRTEWQRPRSRLSIATRPSKANILAERGATLREVIDDNLIPHSAHLHMDKAIASAESYALIDAITAAKDAPQALCMQLKAAAPLNRLPSHRATMHLAAIALTGILAYRDDGLEQVVRLARFLLDNRAVLPLTAEIVDDLDAVVACCRLPMDGAEEHLVFTTTCWDPRFLLTIGNLVRTSSCLNCRTGSHIEALLGYVLEPGVQGIASFILAPRHFARPQDYARLRAAVAVEVPIAHRFDGNRRIAHFRFEDEGGMHEIMTTPLAQAHVRHILKLGIMTTKQLGLKRERAYRQLHPAVFTMKRDVEAITAELAGALGAVRDQPTTMTASRNPGGVYSDAARGIQRKEYIIP